jgi:hypothetical protein
MEEIKNQGEDLSSVDEICELDDEEGQEIIENVHIPADSSSMNVKNADFMQAKDLSEAERRNYHREGNVEIRYVDRVVFS